MTAPLPVLLQIMFMLYLTVDVLHEKIRQFNREYPENAIIWNRNRLSYYTLLILAVCVVTVVYVVVTVVLSHL